jgi:hypothetical protein
MGTTPQPSPKKLRPSTVCKTLVFELIDRLSTDREALASAVEALRSGESLIEAGVLSGVIEDDDERKGHIGAHWIGGQAEQRVLTEGLIRAGELALEKSVPVDAYWVFAGNQFEVAVSHNQQQVTLLVVTPYPDVPTQGDAPPHARIEIFR